MDHDDSQRIDHQQHQFFPSGLYHDGWPALAAFGLGERDDLERLEFILSLTRDLGVNLAGVEVVLNLRDRMRKMQEEMQNIIEKNESKMKSAGLEPERGLEGISSTGLVKLTHQGLRKR